MHCIASVPPHRPLAACRRCDVADTRRQRGSSGGSSRLLIVRIPGLPRSIFCWTTAPCPIFNIPRLTRLFHRPLLTISLLLLRSSSICGYIGWIPNPPNSVAPTGDRSGAAAEAAAAAEQAATAVLAVAAAAAAAIRGRRNKKQ